MQRQRRGSTDGGSRSEGDSNQDGAVRIRASQLGTESGNFANVLIEAGEYQSAISSVEKAVALHEQALGGSQLELAEDLDVLVQGLTLIEAYDRALTTNDLALDIREKQLPPTDIRIARTLEVRGLLLQRRGDYPGARRRSNAR